MENGSRYKRSLQRKYVEFMGYSEVTENSFNPSLKPISNIEHQPEIGEGLEIGTNQNKQSPQSVQNIFNASLISQRRFRKKQNSNQLAAKRLHIASLPTKTSYEPFAVQKMIKITDLIKLFFQKITLNSVFRKPIQYDPYEKSFNYSKHKFIHQIEKIYVPRIIQNLFLTAKFFYILIYVFVFPLTLIYWDIGKSDFIMSLKIIGLFLCVVDILEFCHEGIPQDQMQTISLEQFEKNVAMRKNGIIIELLIIVTIVISIVLTHLQLPIGSFFFAGIIIKMKNYLSSIDWLQSNFFTATHHQKYFNLVKVLSMNLLVCHLLACVLIGITFIRPQDSWMMNNQIHLAPWYEQYIWSYYFGTTIILTIGFGDLHPGNFIQAFFIIVISFCACLFFAYNINYIGNLINMIKQQELQRDNKLKVFNSLAKRTAVSKATFSQITNYIVQSSKIKTQSNYTQQKQLIQQLPQSLRSSFLAQANNKLFNHLQALINFTNKTIQNLSLNIQAKICHPGQVIKKMNQPFSLMILQSGQVGYVAHRKGSRLHNLIIQRISNTIQQQSKLICIDILENEPLNYDIKSLAYSIVYVMDQKVFEECLRKSNKDHQIYRQMLDRCRYKLNEFGVIKCRYCLNKNHTLFECPRLHFHPYKKIFAKNYTYNKTTQKQLRVSYIRKNQEIKYGDHTEKLALTQFMNQTNIVPSQMAKGYSQKIIPKRGKNEEIRRNSFNCQHKSTRNRDSCLNTLEIIQKIREGIQKLKIDSHDVNFQFTLWNNTDCDQIADFKYYFPRHNSSQFGNKRARDSLLAVSKNLKRMQARRILNFC